MTSAKLPRLITLTTLVAVVAVFMGCDSNDNSIAEDACSDLGGIYEATELAFESTENPDVRETFGDQAKLRLWFYGHTFQSQFVSPQQDTLNVDGFYSVDRDANPVQLTLGETPLIPGSEPGPQNFTCESGSDLNFTLGGDDLNYDIDKNGEYEDTRFTAAFDFLSR
jgi:hypothetical protein